MVFYSILPSFFFSKIPNTQRICNVSHVILKIHHRQYTDIYIYIIHVVYKLFRNLKIILRHVRFVFNQHFFVQLRCVVGPLISRCLRPTRGSRRDVSYLLQLTVVNFVHTYTYT